MKLTLLEISLIAALAYTGLGVVFAVLFQLRGLKRVDPAARGATPFFRLLITPGLIALWPVLAGRWRIWARTGAFALAPEKVAPRRLRSMHRLLVCLLAIAIPVLVGAALYWRAT